MQQHMFPKAVSEKELVGVLFLLVWTQQKARCRPNFVLVTDQFSDSIRRVQSNPDRSVNRGVTSNSSVKEISFLNTHNELCAGL